MVSCRGHSLCWAASVSGWNCNLCQCPSTGSWSWQPVPSPCCGTLGLLKTQLGRAWKEHFLWKAGYCDLLSRLPIESFKLKSKFYIFLPEFNISIQRSPHFFFLPTVSASCSSCLFTASLSWALHFHQQQHWCVVTVLSASCAAGLWLREGLAHRIGAGFLSTWNARKEEVSEVPQACKALKTSWSSPISGQISVGSWDKPGGNCFI